MYNISTKSNIRAAHPTNGPDYKNQTKGSSATSWPPDMRHCHYKINLFCISPLQFNLFFFFSQPETPDSSDQIVLSVISSHEPVRTAAAEVEPVLLFPTNFMVQAEISQQILQEQGCSMLGGSISQEIQHLQIS